VRTRHLEVHLAVADPETYWRFQLSHGFAGLIEALAPTDAAELQVRAIAELQRMQATDGIVVDRGAIVYLAELPR
jgi:hypothetical protein